MSDATAPTAAQSSAAPNLTAKRAIRTARYVFWVMFFINFLNYFDRFIFTGLNPSIQASLHLNDFEIGLGGSAFLLVYTLVALPLGFIADRIARKTVVAVGVTVWSVASFATGFASNLANLVGIRAVLGIGEGSYYPSGTPLLAAHYAPANRPQMLGRWAIGALAGGAVGFLAAGFFVDGEAWRNAFFFTGVPGLLLAFLLWRTREKTRHEDDPPAEHLANEGRSAMTRMRAYLRIPTVRSIIGLQALGFFASTTAAFYFVNYLHDNLVTGSQHYPHAGLRSGLAPTLAGAIVLIGSIAGTLFGSPFARWLGRRHTGARVLAGGLGFLFSAPAIIVAVGGPYVLYAIPAYTGLGETSRLIISLIIFCIGGLVTAACFNFYQGPTTCALLDVVPANERAGAGGITLGLSHLLGDVYVLALIGFIADRLHDALGGSQIGLAMLLTAPVVLVASGIVGIRGSKHYAKDVAALGASADALLGVHVAPGH
jgi:hypothetical protein